MSIMFQLFFIVRSEWEGMGTKYVGSIKKRNEDFVFYKCHESS